MLERIWKQLLARRLLNHFLIVVQRLPHTLQILLRQWLIGELILDGLTVGIYLGLAELIDAPEPTGYAATAENSKTATQNCD